MSFLESESDDFKGKSEEQLFPPDKRVTLLRFQGSIFPLIKGQTKLDSCVIWNQIKTNIKGSKEALLRHQDLTKDQYCDEKAFPFKRVRLTPDQKIDVYSVYLRYKAFMTREKMWDDVDKAIGIQRLARQNTVGRTASQSNLYRSLSSHKVVISTPTKVAERTCWNALLCGLT